MQFHRNDSVHLRRAVQSRSMPLYDSIKYHLTRTGNNAFTHPVFMYKHICVYAI